MAVEAVGDGNVTVNVVIAVLSEPKFSVAMAAPVVLLYINAPLHVKLAGSQTTLSNDMYAVPLLLTGTAGTNTLPPATYPAPVTSLSVVYPNVSAFRLALALYKAILYTYGVPVLKFSNPFSTLTLNTVHCVWMIAIMD